MVSTLDSLSSSRSTPPRLSGRASTRLALGAVENGAGRLELRRSLRLALLLLLLVIHCLGPLLHAHIGTPKQTGFHLDVPKQGLIRAIDNDRALDATALFSPDDDAEPFSIHVEQGAGNSGQPLAFDPAIAEALLALFAVVLVRTVFVARPYGLAERIVLPRWRGGSSRPPPALAPPLIP